MNKSIDTIYIVNPSSGRFNGLTIFNKIKYLINHQYILIITTRRNDTQSLIKNLDPNKIKRIIGIGGDGTIKEILEAIIETKNNYIFGHIPTGTGNGLAASILHKNNLPYTIENSLKPIINYQSNYIDIATVEINNSFHHSFLAISIGFISDLDINTEYLRFIGSYRYYIGSLIGLYKMKSYDLDIDYLVEGDNSDTLTLNDKIPESWHNIKGRFIMFWACNVTHPSYDVFISDNIKMDDGFHHLILIPDSISRYELAKILLNLENGNILNHPKVINIKTKQYRVNVNTNQDGLITIDGENVGYTDIHVNVNNKNMKVST